MKNKKTKLINKIQEKLDNRLREMIDERYYELQEYKKSSRATKKEIENREANMNGVNEARVVVNAVIKQFFKKRI